MANRLMCVLAHPDDESLGMGGTLAKYADEGMETFLVCATRGERGWKGAKEDYPGPRALGELRERELRAAADVLGISQVCFLDYLDAQLDEADPTEAIAKIAGHIIDIKPDIVLSFGPDGAYGHPDHIAISQFATAATVEAARGHRVSKLYYMAESKDALDAYQAAFGVFKKEVDGVPRIPMVWADWAITTRLDTSEYTETVWRAIECHESQIRGYEKLKDLSKEQKEAIFSEAAFYRAFSRVNGGRRIEHDLFEGLRG